MAALPRPWAIEVGPSSVVSDVASNPAGAVQAGSGASMMLFYLRVGLLSKRLGLVGAANSGF